MELTQFIKKTSQVLENPKNFVIVFQSSTYAYSFFMQLCDDIKNSLPSEFSEFKTIDMQASDFLCKSQLETSFLGMNCIYWLGDVSGLKSKQKDDLIKYLQVYQGPHKVIAFVDEKTHIISNVHTSIITIKDTYFFEDAKSMFVTEDLEQAQKTALYLQQLYKIKKSFSLDELFLLKNYQDLITADAQEFYQSWVIRLIHPGISLYTLSQLFFEKKADAFFKLWFDVKLLYSEMFWISFWSDQLYRSYFFIVYTQKENFAAAKQVSFGLSFTFMKQTYRQHVLSELQNLHNALFEVDSALKNGGNSYQIDQLYVDFFSGKFK